MASKNKMVTFSKAALPNLINFQLFMENSCMNGAVWAVFSGNKEPKGEISTLLKLALSVAGMSLLFCIY
jgi:hypothetical protein